MVVPVEMATNAESLTISCIFEFLLQKDKQLASAVQNKFNPTRLQSGAPSLIEILSHYCDTNKNSAKLEQVPSGGNTPNLANGKQKDDVSSSDESSEDENKLAKQAPQKKPVVVVVADSSSQEDESQSKQESSSDDSSSEEEVAPAEPVKKLVAKKDSSDDSLSEDEQQNNKGSSLDDSSSDEEVAPTKPITSSTLSPDERQLEMEAEKKRKADEPAATIINKKAKTSENSERTEESPSPEQPRPSTSAITTNSLSKPDDYVIERMPRRPHKPPKSVYSFFACVYSQTVELRQTPVRERPARICTMWNELSDEEKGLYKELWRNSMKHYKREFKAYLANLVNEDYDEDDDDDIEDDPADMRYLTSRQGRRS